MHKKKTLITNMYEITITYLTLKMDYALVSHSFPYLAASIRII